MNEPTHPGLWSAVYDGQRRLYLVERVEDGVLVLRFAGAPESEKMTLINASSAWSDWQEATDEEKAAFKKP